MRSEDMSTAEYTPEEIRLARAEERALAAEARAAELERERDRAIRERDEWRDKRWDEDNEVDRIIDEARLRAARESERATREAAGRDALGERLRRRVEEDRPREWDGPGVFYCGECSHEGAKHADEIVHDTTCQWKLDADALAALAEDRRNGGDHG